jgi:acyl-CoA reductase-like NAD-dependent aldehyde dehydrogenase
LAYRSVNPATGEVITTFANHTDAELQSALSVAYSLYKSDWSNGPIETRLRVLSRLGTSSMTALKNLRIFRRKKWGNEFQKRVPRSN